MRATKRILATFLFAIVFFAADSTIAHEPMDTLAKIKKSGTFVIGYREDARPFSFMGDDGTPSGYSVKLCQHIAAGVKQLAGLENMKIEYKPVPAAKRIDMIANGDVDIECGASTVTLERREKVDFTLATFITGAEMLAAVDSGIEDLPDIAGKTVGVLQGTTTEQGLTNALDTSQIKADVKTFSNHDDGIKALEDGKIEAYFADRILLLGLAEKVKEPSKYRLSGRFYSYEPYAFMIRRGDADLRFAADRTLAELYRSGEIWEVYNDYFGDAKPSELLVALFILSGIPAK